MAIRKKLVRHLRIVALDERVAGRRIGEVAFPSFGGGADESRQRIGAFAQRIAPHGEHFGIGRIALLGEQEHHRLDAAFLDRKRLGGREALLRQLRVDEKGLHAERVGTLLVVGEAVALLQPRPEGRVARRADRDRLSLEVLELRHAGMRDQHGGIFLERRGDGRHGDVLLDGGEHLQRVAHHDVELSGGEELQAVHLRAAHPDRDVEAVLAIGSFGDGLVEASMLRLCEPVGGEDDSIERLRGGARCDAGERQEDAAGDSIHRGGPGRREYGVAPTL